MSKDAAASNRAWTRFNVAVQIFAAIVLLLAANYFGFTHFGRWDFSRSQKFSLSGQTKLALRELKRPVNVTVYFSPTGSSPAASLNRDVQNLLKEFVFSGRDMIFVENVDPTRDLTRAREIQAKYKFSANENLLILDYDGRIRFLPIMDMADFDMSPLETGGEPRLLAFRGEEAFTNALIGLLTPDGQKVMFLEGHGEPSIDAQNSPLMIWREYIEKQNAAVAGLSLSSIDSVPSNCAALVVVAPQVDLQDREIAVLRRYWENKGRLFFLLDPNATTPHLDAFLGEIGIRPRNDRVLRLIRLTVAMGILREVTGEFLPKNPITRRLVGNSIFLPGATQSLALDETVAQANRIALRPLIQPAEEFWGEVDYITDENKGVRYDEGRDAGQPLYVAVSASKGGVSDDRVEIESSKAIVVGSSQFALDAALAPTGLDFLMSGVVWLLDRGDLAGEVPKSLRYFSLDLTEKQLSSLFFFTTIIMPAVAILLGLIAWLRRRS